MIVDFLRACYTRKVRLFADSAEESTIRWYFTTPFAKPLPFSTAFCSMEWEDGREPWQGPGESQPEKEFDRGANPGFLGRCYVGDPSWFKLGMPVAALAGPDPALPDCCAVVPGVGGVEVGGFAGLLHVGGVEVGGSAEVAPAGVGGVEVGGVGQLAYDGQGGVEVGGSAEVAPAGVGGVEVGGSAEVAPAGVGGVEVGGGLTFLEPTAARAGGLILGGVEIGYTPAEGVLVLGGVEIGYTPAEGVLVLGGTGNVST